MGRPRKGKELRPQLSTRVDQSLIDEIDSITPKHGSKSALVEELIVLGLVQYKQKNANLIAEIRRSKERDDRLYEKKRASN